MKRHLVIFLHDRTNNYLSVLENNCMDNTTIKLNRFKEMKSLLKVFQWTVIPY